MKERSESREFKKKTSSQHFYLKHKVNTVDRHGLGKKTHNSNKHSMSLAQFDEKHPHKKRRINSLEIAPETIVVVESKSKKDKVSGSCLSDRNIVPNSRQAHKLFKYRKFSSNCDLQSQDMCSGVVLKQKLSTIQGHKYLQPKDTQKHEQYPLMAWMVIIRKYFNRQPKNKQNPVININNIVAHLGKVHGADLDALKFVIDKVPFQTNLSKQQVATVLENHFKGSKKKEKEGVVKVTCADVLNCLLQHQIKLGSSHKHKDSNSEEHEEGVETARFQEGNSSDESSRKKRTADGPNPSKKTSLNTIVEHTTPSYSQTPLSSHDISPLFIRNRSTLTPSLTAFNILQSQSGNNSRQTLQQYDSQSLFFKKGSFQHGNISEQLGMLTLEGKSPRELMESEIYESMQKLTLPRHKQNVSFSLDNLQLDNHPSFEQTVRSFEGILSKIKKIQHTYLPKMLSEGSQSEEELNLFLQQLINYKMTMRGEDGAEHYSYYVSWEDIASFKEPTSKIMSVLLQSTQMREYFSAIEGIKIEHSPSLYNSIRPLIHSHVKILNISKNNICSLEEVLFELGEHNELELLNINYNQIVELTSVIERCRSIKEIHASHNKITGIPPVGEEQGETLKIIDLSYNLIENEGQLSGISTLKAIEIVNIEGNTILTASERGKWSGLFSQNILYEMNNLYVMSDFGHQKDIAFGRNKQSQHKRKIQKENVQLPLSNVNRPKAIPPLDQKQCLNYGKKSQKELSREVRGQSSTREEPKHKISKIKTFLDGRAI